MTIYEPATLLTDYLLVALAGGLGWRLHRNYSATNQAARWMNRTLGLTALSAFIGGSYHGFAPNFSATVADSWWLITLFTLNLVSATMAMSLLQELAPTARHRLWRTVIGCKLAVFAGIAVFHPVFLVAIVDYGLTMLAWVAAAMLVRRPWSGWMLAGVGLSIIAALVQQLHLSPSPHFNHNDLYHVIQGLAIGAFYQAGTKLGSTREATHRILASTP